MNNSYTNDLSDVDKVIFDSYKDIGESVYKGHDQDCAVFVDMRGDFKLMRISRNENLSRDLTVDEYEKSIIEAVNDAIEKIKQERIGIIGNILKVENGDF